MIRLLCIDDDELFQQSIERTIRVAHRHWSVDMAYDPAHAAKRMAGNDYALIILDVHMPGRNGLSCLKEIRSNERFALTPIIVLTGSDEIELRREMLRNGATDFLSKPCDSEELIARLENMAILSQYQKSLSAEKHELDRLLQENIRRLDYARRSIIWRLAKAGEYRDEETGMHVFRVSEVCRLIGIRMGMDPEPLENMVLASPLHDIGKIGIPDSILLKPGPLDDSEKATIKRHCEIGAEILTEFPRGMLEWIDMTGGEAVISQDGDNHFIEMASVIAMSHHERWDGGGYPHALGGEDIPLEARIVNLSDTFDALCSVRPYKPAFPLEKTLAIMDEQIGGQFDPDVYTAFRDSLDEIMDVRQRLMDTVLTAS